VINNNVHALGSKCCLRLSGLKDLVNFASASGEGKIDILALQVSTQAHAKFLFESQEFYKNGDEFVWIKYCRIEIQFSKFEKVFPCHNFLLYGIKNYK